jgi:hypothetical protein
MLLVVSIAGDVAQQSGLSNNKCPNLRDQTVTAENDCGEYRSALYQDNIIYIDADERCVAFYRKKDPTLWVVKTWNLEEESRRQLDWPIAYRVVERRGSGLNGASSIAAATGGHGNPF